MTLDELNEDQRMELKQQILIERNERQGEGTSYTELALAGDIVSDKDLEDRYGSTEFSPDDFTGSCQEQTAESSPDGFTDPSAKVERIPDWAVCYLVNADDSGLSPEDKEMVDDYVERLLKKDRLRLICPIDGTESEFEPHPAFGLACGTVDFAAEELRDDQSN